MVSYKLTAFTARVPHNFNLTSPTEFGTLDPMQHENTLEGFLRLQLSSDAISALYLPSVLSVLTTAHFSSSPDSQLHKWGTRVTSLIQSKDAGARWAGVCLARRTGELKRELLVEYAQRWINLTLPLLSVCFIATNIMS